MTWIYIQTSISEGLPVSVIEAGLTGKCVICTNVGGCAELLANPNAGGRGWEQLRGWEAT
jgi:glycosyltransferase involved in cell wall biosynthesis